MMGTGTKMLVVVLLVALVGAGVCIFVFSRIGGNQAVAQTTLEELEMELNREAELKAIEGLMRDIASERATLDRQFLKETDIVSFITRLESLDAYTGAVLEIDSVGEQGDRLRIEVTATGSWEEVYHVISMIEALSPASIITETRLNGGGGVWTAVLVIETFLTPKAS